MNKKIPIIAFSGISTVATVICGFIASSALLKFNFLPGRYLALVILLYFVVLIFSVVLIARKKLLVKFLGFTLQAMVIALSIVALGYLNQTTELIAKISVAGEQDSSRTESTRKDFDITKDSFHLFVGGVDASEVLNDVNMILSVNPKTQKVLITSIPRDYYVPFHNTKIKDKLTHSGAFMGADITNTMLTVDDFMKIDLGYYLRVNFASVQSLVDMIGGIDLVSDLNVRSSTMPRCRFGRGENHVDGYCALAFARERKAYGNGDLHRIENQAVVMEAIIQKISRREVFLAHYDELMNILPKVIQTNLPEKYIYDFLRLEIDQTPQWHVQKQRLNGTHIFNVASPYYGNRPTTMIEPDWQSIKKAQKNIRAVMK